MEESEERHSVTTESKVQDTSSSVTDSVTVCYDVTPLPSVIYTPGAALNTYTIVIIVVVVAVIVTLVFSVISAAALCPTCLNKTNPKRRQSKTVWIRNLDMDLHSIQSSPAHSTVSHHYNSPREARKYENHVTNNLPPFPSVKNKWQTISNVLDLERGSDEHLNASAYVTPRDLYLKGTQPGGLKISFVSM